MGQSGLLSAVGVAIESVFTRAPLTVATSPNYTIGVTGTNPHRFSTVDPGGGMLGKATIDAPGNEITGGVIPRRTMLTAKVYDGGIPFKGDGENLYYALLGMMGRDIQGTAITGPPSMYPHTFAPNQTFPSFTIEEIFGAGTWGRVTTGCIFTKLDMTFGKTLDIKSTIMGYRSVPNNYPNAAGVKTNYLYGATPAVIPAQCNSALGNGTNTWSRTTTPNYVDVPQGYDDTGPFTFGGATFGTLGGSAFTSAFLTLDGNPVAGAEILEGFNLSVDRKVDASMIMGSGFDPGTTTGGEVTCSGKISLLFEDTTFQVAHLQHATVGLNFLINGPSYQVQVPHIL